MGRLSRAGLPRRGRDPDPEPRRKAAEPLFSRVARAARAQLPARCVLDGEIVIAKDGGLDFEALQLRLHPAASRVKLLSQQIPASVVFFDLLCEGDRDLRGEPFQERRQELESLLSSAAAAPSDARDRRLERRGGLVSPLRRRGSRRRHGQAGFGRLRAGQARDAQGEARARLRLRGGRFSMAQEGRGHGGRLAAARACSTIRARCSTSASARASPRRSAGNWWNSSRPIARTRSPIILGRAGRSIRNGEAGQRMPGGQSRWSQGKDLSWEPLRPELVVEVAYEHMQGARFRHMAQFRRWRTDKKPSDCTYAQLEVVPPQELMEIFAAAAEGWLAASCYARLLAARMRPPFPRRIVVGVGSLLRGPQRFGHMAQVHADAGPGG